MNRLLPTCFLVVLLFLPAFGQVGDEVIELTLGDLKEISLPFEATGVGVGDPSVVDAKLPERNVLMLTAKKEGTTGVIVKGIVGSTRYEVRVEPDTHSLIRSVGDLLEGVPEIEVSRGHGGRVILRGTVSNPERYAMFKKVENAFQGDVMSFVEFRPADEILARLESAIKHGGFTIIPEGQTGLPEQIALSTDGSVITLRGKVYSQKQLMKLAAILSAQRWLVMQDKEDRSSLESGEPTGEGRVSAYLDIEIEETVIDLDVRVISVDSAKLTAQGFNALRNAQLDTRAIFGQAYGSIGRFNKVGNQAGNYLLDLSMNSTFNLIEAFNEDHVSNRIDIGGHLMFSSGVESEDNPPAVMRSGKTFLLQPRVGFGGTSSGFQTLTTGFNITASGVRISENLVSLNVSLDMRSAQNPGQAAFVTQDEVLINRNIVVPFGKTMVLSGKNEFKTGKNSDGLPGVKKNPVMKFFTSSRKKDSQLSRLVLMVSPRRPPEAMSTIPVRAETLPLTRTIRKGYRAPPPKKPFFHTRSNSFGAMARPVVAGVRPMQATRKPTTPSRATAPATTTARTPAHDTPRPVFTKPPPASIRDSNGWRIVQTRPVLVSSPAQMKQVDQLPIAKTYPIR